MLHVDPVPPSPVPHTAVRFGQNDHAFDPLAYIANVRSYGMQIRARMPDGRRQLSWDLALEPQPDVNLRQHEDPRLDLDADPDNEQLVWETLRAEAWLVAARASGLIVFPWLTTKGRPTVMECGQDENGSNLFSAALDRFVLHPDFSARKSCRKAVVFATVCAAYGVRPDDPDLNAKIDADIRSRYLTAEQVAS